MVAIEVDKMDRFVIDSAKDPEVRRKRGEGGCGGVAAKSPEATTRKWMLWGREGQALMEHRQPACLLASRCRRATLPAQALPTIVSLPPRTDFFFPS